MDNVKMLFIYTNDLNGSHGGSAVTRNALSQLEKLFSVYSYYIYEKPTKISIFINSILGYLKSSLFKYFQICKLINELQVKIVYFDDCVNGKIVSKIKKRYPTIFIVTHFHNNEINYYKDLVKQQGLLYYPLYKASKKNQEFSLLYSDYKIFITEEDLKSIGGKNNSFVIPVTKKDMYKNPNPSEHTSDYLLFFGNSFFPNNEAVLFIIKQIAPFIHEKILIAGNKMDVTFSNIKLPENVTVIGYVENLSELFIHAKAFLCPIVSGSGMKVKIADALMFGKTIIATDFAAIGYKRDKDVFLIGKDADDFIKIISSIENCENSYNDKARAIFKNYYDSANALEYYETIKSKYEEYSRK